MSKKESPKKPIWLPDWQDLCKYPDVNGKKISGRVWAWEFLRRNQKYQQLWEKYEALPPGPIYEGHSARAYIEIRERFEIEFGVLCPAPPSMPFAHPDFKWRPQFTAHIPRHWILPPDWSDHDDFEKPEIDLEHPTEVLVKFDLRLQRKPQLLQVDRILKTEAKRLTQAGVLSGEPRAWFDRYQKYLRVLDAKLSGVITKTIAKEILGIKSDPKDRVDYAFESAKRLRDGDYRFLAALRGK